MASDGDAFIDVHADTTPYDRELETGIRKASNDADEVLDEVGRHWGNTLADSTSKELGKHGKDFARSVEKGIENEVVHIRGKRYVIDRRGRLHDAAGRFVKVFEEEIGNALSGGDSGIIRTIGHKIGRGFADAIGAGFNISGRSPLIALLIPAVGALIGLIVGAVQAVNGLAAALTTIPALIASIGIQVGVLFLAFKGLGGAISGAFAAKNAKELQEALKGLTPPAQSFVRELLKLKPLFKAIQETVQSNFFKALGDPFASLRFLSPTLLQGFADAATALGTFFRDLAAFFNSPTFIAFVRDVFPATVRWINRFGPAFIAILGSLIGMADQALPLLERIGAGLSNSLLALSNFLNQKIRSGAFQNWADRMYDTLALLGDVLVSAGRFLAVFMAQLDRAGGAAILETIIQVFDQWSAFLSSPQGLKAMEGIVDLSIAFIDMMGELVLAILAVIAVLEVLGEGINNLWKWITTVVDPAIGDFLSMIFHGFTQVDDFVRDVWNTLGDYVVTRFRETIHGVAEWLRKVPRMARDAVGNLGRILFDAGRALIQGLIDGIKSKAEDVGRAARNIIHKITDWFPGSPAKVGPLSGQGYSLYRGERMIQDLGTGMQKGFNQVQAGLDSDLGALVNMLTPTTNTTTGVNFGPGAIRITFEGVVPTEEQARQVGRAVGTGINDQLMRRNTVLAVRTL